MTKGRSVPKHIDHAAGLRERLGMVAYVTHPASEIAWDALPETIREHWRISADAVMQAIVKPGQRAGTIGVASSYGAATKRPYVELTCDISPSQFSPAKAREIALMLLECADAAESDALLIEFAREQIGLDDVRAAQLLILFRQRREKARGRGVDTA